MLSKIQYYTGIIFQAYTYGIGEPVVKGGRYNELLKHFGKPAASIGFVIVVDNLLDALSRQKIEVAKDEAPCSPHLHRREQKRSDPGSTETS